MNALSAAPTVFLRDNAVLTNSLDVAAYFEKQHGHVMRDIRALIAVNHAPDPRLIALNLPELAKHAAAGRLVVLVNGALRRALHQSTAPAFLSTTTVRSRLTKSPLRCWVFRRVGDAHPSAPSSRS